MVVLRHKAQDPIAARSNLLLSSESVEDDTKNPTRLLPFHLWRLIASIALVTFVFASTRSVRLFLSTPVSSQQRQQQQAAPVADFTSSAFFAENPSNVVTEQMKIDFLTKYNANGMSHSNINLLHHLKGTRDLLLAWDQPHYIQDAGLFHSVYGTEVYKKRAVPISERPVLRALIGTEAEDLIWAFGVMSRDSFEEQSRNIIITPLKSEEAPQTPSGGLPDDEQVVVYKVACSDRQKQLESEKSCELVLDRAQMHALAIVHTANTAEQAPRFLTKGHKTATKWSNRLERHKQDFVASLPLSAVAHIGALLEQKNHQQRHVRK